MYIYLSLFLYNSYTFLQSSWAKTCDFVVFVWWWYRRGEKAAAENSFRSMLQESGMGLAQVQWRPESEFKQVSNRGFSLDQNQFSPQYSSGDSTVTSQGLHPSTFHQNMDSTALYGSPSSILQGLLGPDNNNQQQQQQPHQANSFDQNRPMNFPYPSGYGLSSNNELVPSWSNKVPQFLRGSPPKQLSPPNNQLHFTNNAPFWNASEAAAIKDVRSSFFPSLQPPFSTTPNFDVQSKVYYYLVHNIFYNIDVKGIGMYMYMYNIASYLSYNIIIRVELKHCIWGL